MKFPVPELALVAGPDRRPAPIAATGAFGMASDAAYRLGRHYDGLSVFGNDHWIWIVSHNGTFAAMHQQYWQDWVLWEGALISISSRSVHLRSVGEWCTSRWLTWKSSVLHSKLASIQRLHKSTHCPLACPSTDGFARCRNSEALNLYVIEEIIRALLIRYPV